MMYTSEISQPAELLCNVQLDEATSEAVFALYDDNKRDGLLSENAPLRTLIERILPGRDCSAAKYSYHPAYGNSTKGITIDFLIEGEWEGEHTIDSYRFDPGDDDLRHATRNVQRRKSPLGG